MGYVYGVSRDIGSLRHEERAVTCAKENAQVESYDCSLYKGRGPSAREHGSHWMLDKAGKQFPSRMLATASSLTLVLYLVRGSSAVNRYHDSGNSFKGKNI